MCYVFISNTVSTVYTQSTSWILLFGQLTTANLSASQQVREITTNNYKTTYSTVGLLRIDAISASDCKLLKISNPPFSETDSTKSYKTVPERSMVVEQCLLNVSR